MKSSIAKLAALAGKTVVKGVTRFVLPGAVVLLFIEDAKAHSVGYAVLNLSGVPDIIELAESGITATRETISRWVDDGWYNNQYKQLRNSGFSEQEAMIETLKALHAKQEAIQAAREAEQGTKRIPQAGCDK